MRAVNGKCQRRGHDPQGARTPWRLRAASCRARGGGHGSDDDSRPPAHLRGKEGDELEEISKIEKDS